MKLRTLPLVRDVRNALKYHSCPFIFELCGGSILRGSTGASGVEAVAVAPSTELLVPSLRDLCDGREISGRSVRIREAVVYRIEGDRVKTRIVAAGGVALGRRAVIASGVHPSASLLALLKKPPQKQRKESVILLPWAHPWWSFGDFMTFVLPALCRILSVVSADERKRAVIALPRAYQKPFLGAFADLLGFSPEQLVDLEVTDLAAAPGGVIYSTNGFFHDSYIAHPHDFKLLRQAFAAHTATLSATKKYYFRRGKPRLYKQEAEVIAPLREAGFEIVDDISRSAVEQIELFASAKVVAGAHGGAFGNINFMQPGSTLVELQHPCWMCACYRFMAHVEKINYQLAVGPAGRMHPDPIQGFSSNAIDVPAQLVTEALKAV